MKLSKKHNEKAITIPDYPKSFIYFLLKNEDVIYIGQTKNGIYRPLCHKDKEHDTIKIMKCPPELLDVTENYLISQYKPIFNKTSTFYKLDSARRMLQEIFNRKITTKELQGYIDKLQIKLTITETRGHDLILRLDAKSVFEIAMYINKELKIGGTNE